MIVLIVFCIMGAWINNKLTKDKPFQPVNRMAIRWFGAFFGFAIWYVIVNPLLGNLATYETNVKSIEIAQIKHDTQDDDMDIMIIEYTKQDGVRNVPSEKRINLKHIDSITVVPDVEIFQGDTIVNTSRFVHVSESSISELYHLGSKDKTDYIRLSESDYKKLPPVFRKYKKHKFIFRLDSTFRATKDTNTVQLNQEILKDSTKQN